MHTDVPEFRGANRKLVPQWLLVVMLHSGCFDDYRMPIATGIAWFHDCDGGALAYWPDGADGPVAVPTRSRYNTAMVLDTDTVFHGVEPHRRSSRPRICRALRPGMTLDYAGDGRGSCTTPNGAEVTRYDWPELRFSVSWKAYCFADEHERDAWRDAPRRPHRRPHRRHARRRPPRTRPRRRRRHARRRARPPPHRRVHPLPRLRC